MFRDSATGSRIFPARISFTRASRTRPLIVSFIVYEPHSWQLPRTAWTLPTCRWFPCSCPVAGGLTFRQPVNPRHPLGLLQRSRSCPGTNFRCRSFFLFACTFRCCDKSLTKNAKCGASCDSWHRLLLNLLHEP